MLLSTNVLHRFHKPILLAALLAGLQACGGSDDKKSSPHSSSSADSSVSLSSAGSLSSASTSSVSSMAAITTHISGMVSLQDINGDPEDIQDANSVAIYLALVDENQQTLDELETTLAGSISDAQSLPFSGSLEADNARYVVINIRKPGYTDYARRIDVQTSITISATLSELPTGEIESSSAQTISGESITGFNFSVVATDDGQNVQQGNGDAIPEMSVSISEAALPEGTASIDVKMQAFDPNDADDAAYFPGAYEDSTGNKLLSVAFNYTDVTTNEGVSLQKLAMKTRQKRLAAEKRGINFQKLALEAEPVIINRTIPSDSCLSLSQLGDSDAQTLGFQVPVYTYNPDSGVWDLLGHGTVYSEEGELIDSAFRDFDCSQFMYVLEIRVTNEIFISNWWNLDYPLVFDQPTTLCATLALKNEQGLPMTGAVIYVDDDDNQRSFSAETFVTDGNGITNIQVYSLDGGLDTTANLTIYTQGYSQRIEKTFDLSTDCANVTPLDVLVEAPAMCNVEGKAITSTGAPIANSFMYAWASNDENYEDSVWVVPAFGQTDGNGQYILSVSCNAEYVLFEYYSWLANFYAFDQNDELANRFNVDGNVGANEVADDGKSVLMADVEVNRNKPYAYAFNTDGSSRLDINFYYAGENYPLHYELDIIDNEDNVVGHFSGEITAADIDQERTDSAVGFDEGMVSVPHNLTATEFSMFSVTGTITDAQNNEGSIYGYVYLGEPN